MGRGEPDKEKEREQGTQKCKLVCAARELTKVGKENNA